MSDVKPIPDGYPRLSPYLCVDGASDAIAFYTEVLGGTERMRMDAPGGRVGHAEIEIGDSVVMLADPFPHASTTPPSDAGATTAAIVMYVEDVDAVVSNAVDAGATITEEVEDKFWGDRFGTIRDPFGHVWSIGTHVEDVSPQEMAERAKSAMAAMSS
jgi:PhnB protein